MTQQTVSDYAKVFASKDSNLRGAVHALDPKKHKEWAETAHLDWNIEESPVSFKIGKVTHTYPNRKVLYRSDSEDPLAVVSPRYKVVQPKQILSFFENVSNEFGFELEMAGQAIGGRRIWAMARTGSEVEVMKGDRVAQYLLLITACDGGLATTAMTTSVRLWCANQMPMLMREAKKKKGAGVVRITHSAKFDEQVVRKGLGLVKDSWLSYEKDAKALAKKKVSKEDAVKYFTDLFGKGEDVKLETLNANSTLHRVLETYQTGVGQQAAVGTAWGLVNAVTRYIDHEGKSNNPDTRIYNAWMNTGARVKQQAWERAIALVK